MSHRTLSDDELERQLIDGSLPAEWFGHEAHLRLAWIYVQRYPLAQAQAATGHCIQCYVQHLGAMDKYHHTLTLAAVQVVAHFAEQTQASDFEGLLEAMPRLRTHFMDLMHQHYSPERLQSAEAHYHYLEPDRLIFA